MLRRLLGYIKPFEGLTPMPKWYFSDHKHPTFSDIEQKAAYAYFALEFIISIKPEDIYEKSLSIR